MLQIEGELLCRSVMLDGVSLQALVRCAAALAL